MSSRHKHPPAASIARRRALLASHGVFQVRKRLNNKRRHRRGAALIEGALVLGTLLTLLLAMFDLAGAVYRHNMLSEATRRGVREAIVHGKQAAPERDVWGPNEYSGTAADSSGIAEIVRPLLVGMRPQDVTITLQWPEGSNTAPDRVRCRMSTVYRPISPVALGSAISLSATATMPITH